MAIKSPLLLLLFLIIYYHYYYIARAICTGQPDLHCCCCCLILSLNPMIDIGQIEGGFVFGLGFNLLEDIIYDKDTGVVLNDGTWVST